MTRRRRRMRSRHRAGTRVFYETRGSSPRPRDRSDRAFAACARDGDGGFARGGSARRRRQAGGSVERRRVRGVVGRASERPVVRRSAGKPVAHGKWRAADRVCDATVGGGTETMGRRVWKCRARESKQARTCRFPIFDDIAPAPRSRETPCLARCGAHAPADGRAMWAAVVYKSWSTGKTLLF
jgi:hypothetical protein